MKKKLVALAIALLATAYVALGADPPADCPSCTGDDHKCCPVQVPPL